MNWQSEAKYEPSVGYPLSDINRIGLQPTISLPTRITPTSATLIDNILTTDHHKPITSGVLCSNISDHLPIFYIISNSCSTPNSCPKYILKRDLRDGNKKKFKECLSEWGNNFQANSASVVEDASRFRNELRDAYNICFPQKKIRIKNINLLKPWLNNDALISKIKYKNKLIS